MTTKAGPYLYRRYANGLAVECTHEAGIELVATQGGYLEYDATWKPAPRVRQPKPRKPKSRVFVADLPLTNTPAAAPLADRGACEPVTATGGWTVAAPPAIEPASSAGQAGELTQGQVKRLEHDERWGLLSDEGRANLDAWRTKELNKQRKRFVRRAHPLAWLRRILSPSFGKEG